MKIFNLYLNRIHPNLWYLIYLFIPSLIFGWITVRPLTGFLRPISLALRVDLWPVIPIAAIIIYLLFRVPGRTGELISLAAISVLFVMPLAGLWAYGHTQTSVVSGLIQMNDARGYYIDALRLTTGESFSFFSSRRPLFPGFLSVLLVVTNFNLMATLSILSAVTAISCYLMAREIQRTAGVEAAVFLLIMVFLYYRLHSGITMSENFGIALGCLGFTFLWRGANDKSLKTICIGIFSTTLALNARAGAFFMLPMIVLWAGWLFHDTKITSWKAVAITLITIVLGFASNFMLGKLIGQPGGIPFANFSYTLYSLASGGKSWAYISESHPEVFILPEPEHTKKVFQLAFELMKERPYQTIQGAIFFWKAIFTDTLYNVFAFVAKENWVINPFVKWLLYLLSVIGLGYSAILYRKSATNILIIVSIIGIFLSIPFAPPTDSFRMRPYAASIAFICMLPALGFGYITTIVKQSHREKVVADGVIFNYLQFTNLVIVTIILIGPLIVKSTSKEMIVSSQVCEPGYDYVITNFSKGTYISIAKNKDDFSDWPPNFHIYLFQQNAHGLEDTNMINWLETVKSGETLLLGLDRAHSKGSFLLNLPTKLVPISSDYYQICGHFEKNPSLKFYSIFYGNKVSPLITNH